MKIRNQIFLFISVLIPVYVNAAPPYQDTIQQATTYAKKALEKTAAAKVEFEKAVHFINQLKTNCKTSGDHCDHLEREFRQLNETLVKTNKEFNEIRNKVVKTIDTVELVANRANLMLETYESVSNSDSMNSYIAGLHTLATTTVDIGKEINLIDDNYHLPAYSRTTAELGFLNSDSSYIPQGNITIYPWQNLGIQADISGGKIDGDTSFNYGGHLFWRDSKRYMLGATIARVSRAKNHDIRYGMETELYFLHPDWTLRVEGGYQVGTDISSVYGGLLTTWYPRFNLAPHNYGELADVFALKGGVYGYEGHVLAKLGLEVEMRALVDYFKNYAHRQHNNSFFYALTEFATLPFQIFPRNSSFFIEGGLGSNDIDYVLMGINIYLGNTPNTAHKIAKALKYKHRYQFVESSLFVNTVPKRP